MKAVSYSKLSLSLAELVVYVLSPPSVVGTRPLVILMGFLRTLRWGHVSSTVGFNVLKQPRRPIDHLPRQRTLPSVLEAVHCRSESQTKEVGTQDTTMLMFLQKRKEQ